MEEYDWIFHSAHILDDFAMMRSHTLGHIVSETRHVQWLDPVNSATRTAMEVRAAVGETGVQLTVAGRGSAGHNPRRDGLREI